MSYCVFCHLPTEPGSAHATNPCLKAQLFSGSIYATVWKYMGRGPLGKRANYIVVGSVNMKHPETRQWVPAVLYHTLEKPDELYVREKFEFFERFDPA